VPWACDFALSCSLFELVLAGYCLSASVCSTWFSGTSYRLRYWGVFELSFEQIISASVFFGLHCIVDRKLLLGIYSGGQLRIGC